MQNQMIIDGRRITDNDDAYVIAEIGQNHQGDVERAKEMFQAAKWCGVDAVKLQKRSVKELYTKKMYDMSYENEQSFGPTYGQHREALEFDADEYRELIKYASDLGLTMFATGWDYPSVDLLAGLGVPAFKIASGDLTSIPFLKHVAGFGKPMIVSTGGATMEDVQRAYDAIMPLNRRLCLLQCTARYPVEPKDMNLRVITTYKQCFPDVVVGLSDHQSGIAMSIVAYMLGARVFEKHFTLNRAFKGTDHAFSLEPHGMQKMIRDLRRARVALGDGVKRPQPFEEKALYKMGKKLVAATSLPAKHVLTKNDVALKSPNDGLPPYELENVLGKKLKTPLQKDDNITFENLC